MKLGVGSGELGEKTMRPVSRQWLRLLLPTLHSALPTLLLLALAGCHRNHNAVDAVWAGAGRGGGEVVQPRGIDYDPASHTFVVVDRTARVQRYDSDGKFLNGWRMPEWERGKPVGITVAPDGLIWMPDTHYHRVVVYKPDGTIVKMFGQRGSGDGEFEFPTDIAFAPDGRVFVSEYGGNDRVQVFDQEGKFLSKFGGPGNGPEQFSRPQSMLILNGELLIADACNHRLQVWSLDGKHLRDIGQVGSAPGEFRFPYGLSADAAGEVLVTEYGNTRVQKIDPKTGKSLAIWGSSGRLPGELAYPWATAVDEKGRCVVIDAGNNRMQVFHF